MNNYIIKESDDEEAKLIIDKLVNYNLSIVPQTQEQPFIWINRVIRNFDFQAKDFYIEQGYEVFGILDNCPENYRRYYMKKSI